MKKLIPQFLAIMLMFLLSFSISGIIGFKNAQACENDSCDFEKVYEASANFYDTRVLISFNNASNPTKIQVDARSGYQVTKIELDVVNGQFGSGYQDYTAIYPGGMFDPNPGDQILSAKVTVIKICKKIQICHRTNANPQADNPYNDIEVSINAADGTTNGDHNNHTGGIYDPSQAEDPHYSWGDIIPPFNFNGGEYPGLNWTSEGQAIWENGCQMPEDLCSNIEGIQTSIPQGFEDPNEDKICTRIEEPPVDLCENIEGIQREIPTGYEDPDKDKSCTAKVSTPTISPQILGTSTVSGTTNLPTTGVKDNSIYYLLALGILMIVYYLKKEGWQRIG